MWTRLALPPTFLLSLPFVSLWLLGCQDLSRFETQPGEAYCGTMVSSPVFHEGLLPAAVPPVLPIRLELNIHALDSLPGVVTTGDKATGLCAASGQPLLNHAPLRAIPTLAHDQLSLLEFGDGREQNLMAWVDSTCQGTLLGVLSLMKDSTIELRLLKPKPFPAPGAAPADQPGFGLFTLARKAESNCSY
ncbi:MAG: hypothetical protein SFV15_25005 [Polyangiaceae bacterium]|nr:hypothetical protein [Polyangiaceae bacterium]